MFKFFWFISNIYFYYLHQKQKCFNQVQVFEQQIRQTVQIIFILTLRTVYERSKYTFFIFSFRVEVDRPLELVALFVRRDYPLYSFFYLSGAFVFFILCANSFHFSLFVVTCCQYLLFLVWQYRPLLDPTTSLPRSFTPSVRLLIHYRFYFCSCV